MGQSGQHSRVQRSPNYPFLSLRESVTRARAIYEKERRAAASKDTILRHLGFTTTAVKGGVGGRTLSALNQYGLLEDDGNGQARLSELGFQLAYLTDDKPQRVSLLREAARRPRIFAEIMDQYADGFPSDENLRDQLVLKWHFNPQAVDRFVKVFKETVQVAGLDLAVPADQVAGLEEPRGTGGEDQVPDGGQFSVAAAPSLANTREAADALRIGLRVFSWPLSIVRNVSAELRLVGTDWRRSDLGRLQEHIRQQLALLDAAIAEEEEVAGEG